jgi:cellobiose-specific phosphotransferase system component IIB
MARMSKLQESYLEHNIDKQTPEELSKVTGLSVKVIEGYAKKVEKAAEESSVGLDKVIEAVSQHEANVAPSKPYKSDAVKRMTKTKGVTVLTPEMADKGDIRKSGVTTKVLGQSIHRIYRDE